MPNENQKLIDILDAWMGEKGFHEIGMDKVDWDSKNQLIESLIKQYKSEEFGRRYTLVEKKK